MKPNEQQPINSQQAIKQLEAKKEKVQDPALKAAIDKKIELLKTGRDIKK